MVEEAVMELHHPYLDPEKQVKVVFTEFGDSSINFQLLCWVDAIRQIYVVTDVMQCIYDTLNEHNIEIPFPQHDVHIINKPKKAPDVSIRPSSVCASCLCCYLSSKVILTQT